MNRPSLPSRHDGFSLIELILVLAIGGILAVLLIPSVAGLRGANDITSAGYTLSGLLEQARTYALANNTYVWVGFFEEDGTQASQQPAVVGNGGRLVVSIVASSDGRRYSDATISATLPMKFGAMDTSNPVTLIQINKLTKINRVRLVAVNTGTLTSNNPVRPGVNGAYQMGDAPTGAPLNDTGSFAQHVGAPAGNPTTFTFPFVTSGTPQYTFSKIIEFNPRGEASKIDENVFSGPGPQDQIEIALDPMPGGTIPVAYAGTNQNKAAVAIQIEGLTGKVRLYRP